ncbi:MAG: desulfoferrodoxin family protein [Desulfobacterota bacterium]|nr:desulfoferrodoxin family protein [Thermodesulfobacteriota bacterium]
MERREFLLSLPFFLLTLRTGVAFANKSSTTIEAPETVQKGSEVTIRVTVHHKGNNFLHYTNWLSVKVNQKEVARWEFSSGNRPEAEVFTREVKHTALEDMEVVAQANCNLHGSTGPSVAKIAVKG